MKYRLDEQSVLHAEPETRAEAIDLNQISAGRFRHIDPIQHPEAYVYWLNSKTEIPLDGHWVEAEATTSSGRPYLEKLTAWTGFTGRFRTYIDMAEFLSLEMRNGIQFILTTGMLDKDGVMLNVTGFACRHEDRDDRIGKRELEPVEKSQARFIDNVISYFGDRPYEPEFLPSTHAGRYKPNPKYLRRQAAIYALPAHPHEPHRWLWRTMWLLWLRDHASDKQRTLAENTLRIDERFLLEWDKGLPGPRLVDCVLCVRDANGPADWDGKGTRYRAYNQDDFRRIE